MGEDKITFVTYQMYQIVRDAMLAEIKAVPGIWDDCSEIAVLGGVQINRFNKSLQKREALEAQLKSTLKSDSEFADAKKILDEIDFEGADAFQPLFFQTTTKNGDNVDLFASTFGAKPELHSIVGSRTLADQILSGTV